jgi:O-antigen ligase
MLQRDVLKFYERGWANGSTVVTLASGSAAVAMPAVLERDDAEAPWVVGRLELWGAALRLIQTRPLLGVGPDNFRHLYGAQLGLETWDERVQANNLYLEVLADVGVLGLAAFLWMVGAPLRRARLLIKENALALGVILAIGAFLVHGLLDSFLAFTPTALLLWMLLGMLAAQKPQVSGR